MAANCSTAPDFHGTFARLIPKNQAAKDIFLTAVARMKRNEDSFHLQFVSCAPKEQSFLTEGIPEPVESDTEYDTYDTAAERQLDRADRPDHFILSFEKGIQPMYPQQGWRVGKGTSKSTNRNVEFLLAPPGCHQSRHLANVHLYFRFNHSSGMLMLVAGSEKAPVQYNVGGVWKELAYPWEKLLYQSATMIRLGPFEYELMYPTREAQRDEYFFRRNRFLEAMSSQALPPAHLKKLHLDHSTLIRDILVFETKGCGSFGWVNIALDTNTGDPLAIKELRITSKGTADAFTREVTLGKQFSDQVGLVSIKDSWCEHNKDRPCGIIPEKGFICMPLAQTDFSRPFWTSPIVDIKTKLSLLKDTLKGISTMHGQGFMHRDITRKNMLILSLQPPRAVVCDYGRATPESKPASTVIGPVGTLAPEVWNGSTYSNKIDLWAWAYAVAEVLGYSGTGNCKITPKRLASIHYHLENYRAASEEKPLVQLLLQLLVWNPDNRISAKEALSHCCWDESEEATDSSHMLFEAKDSRSKKPRAGI